MKSESKYNNPPTSRRGQNMILFSPAHREQKISVTTAGKGGYTVKVKNIYGAPPPYPEEHHEVIKDMQTIVQGMITQGYDMEGLAQAN